MRVYPGIVHEVNPHNFKNHAFFFMKKSWSLLGIAGDESRKFPPKRVGFLNGRSDVSGFSTNKKSLRRTFGQIPTPIITVKAWSVFTGMSRKRERFFSALNGWSLKLADFFFLRTCVPLIECHSKSNLQKQWLEDVFSCFLGPKPIFEGLFLLVSGLTKSQVWVTKLVAGLSTYSFCWTPSVEIFVWKMKDIF